MLDKLLKINFLLSKKSKKQFGILLFLLMLKSFLDGFGLGLVAPYIAAVGDPSLIFENAFFKKINFVIKVQDQQELILYLSFFLIIFFILKNIYALFVTYLQSRLIFTSRSILGRKLFELYLNAPFDYHLDHNTAELDRNLRFENTNTFAFIQSLLTLSSNIFLIISIFTVLILANWQAVTVIGFFIITFSTIFLSISGKYSKKFGNEVQKSQLKTGQAMKEGLSSIIDSKLFNIESFFPKRFFSSMMLNAKANWRQVALGAAPTLFFEILAVNILAGSVIFLSFNNIDLKEALPILGLFSFAFVRLLPSTSAAIKNLQDIKFLSPSVDVVYSDFIKLGKKNQTINEKRPSLLTTDFKDLKLENIFFSFSKTNKKENQAINNLSLTISKGKSIGITGPSGSGKTTLINIILGLLDVDKGKIFFNDELLKDNLRKWHMLISYVPQSINLIDSSIKNNIALGKDKIDINDKNLWKAINDANILKFINSLPDGIDTIIGENGVRLSGGQRQRLGLARALYRNPKVLIFDEATSALDVETEKSITQEIMKMSGERTLIIVAHRINTIKDCDIIYYMNEGTIQNFGNFKELKKLNKDFRELTSN